MVQIVHVEKDVAAPAHVLWGYLSDSSSWPEWTTTDDCQILQPADAHGVGEVRLFRTGRRRVVERVVAAEQSSYYAYSLLSGLAVTNYLAAVKLTPRSDDCTAVTWHTEFDVKVPGTGWLYRRALTSYTQRFVAGLAAVSEHSHGKDPG